MKIKYHHFVLFLLTLSASNCSQADPSPNASDSSALLPAPQEEELAEGVATLEAVYATEYRRTKGADPARKKLACSSLAKRLLETAGETSATNPGYYPMLSESIRLATLADKAENALNAVDLLSKSHDVRASQMKLVIFQHFTKNEVRLRNIRDASNFILGAIQDAANNQNLSSAVALIDEGDSMASRLLDRGLQRRIDASREILSALVDQESRVESARMKLEKTPKDADANLSIAIFLGLRKGDWEAAEIYASRVNEDAMRSLFIRELSPLKDPQEVLSLAHDWWAFSETQLGAEKLQAIELAATHYESIIEDLTGFDQRHVETRLKGLNRDHVVAVRSPLMMMQDQSSASKQLDLTGLVAYYPFNGNAKDESGNGYHGTERNVEAVPDRFGNEGSALHFAGVPSSYVEIRNPVKRFNTMTISLWLNYAESDVSSSDNQGTLFSIPRKTRDRWLGSGLKIKVLNKARLGHPNINQKKGDILVQFLAKQSKEGLPSGQPAGWAEVPVRQQLWGQWSHLVVVVVGNEHLDVYKQGEIEGSTKYVNPPELVDVIQFGREFADRPRPGTSLSAMRCNIDEVRIYNRALSPEEVKALYDYESR